MALYTDPARGGGVSPADRRGLVRALRRLEGNRR